LSQRRWCLLLAARPIGSLFRHKRLRYRGLAKNTAQLHTLFALANLVIVKKALLARGGVCEVDPENETVVKVEPCP